MTSHINFLPKKLIPLVQRTTSANFRQIGPKVFFSCQYWVRALKWLLCLSVLPANCCSYLDAESLCSTVGGSYTNYLLKFQLPSVKITLAKTTFKNGYEYRGHPDVRSPKWSMVVPEWAISSASWKRPRRKRAISRFRFSATCSTTTVRVKHGGSGVM